MACSAALRASPQLGLDFVVVQVNVVRIEVDACVAQAGDEWVVGPRLCRLVERAWPVDQFTNVLIDDPARAPVFQIVELSDAETVALYLDHFHDGPVPLLRNTLSLPSWRAARPYSHRAAWHVR